MCIWLKILPYLKNMRKIRKIKIFKNRPRLRFCRFCQYFCLNLFSMSSSFKRDVFQVSGIKITDFTPILKIEENGQKTVFKNRSRQRFCRFLLIFLLKSVQYVFLVKKRHFSGVWDKNWRFYTYLKNWRKWAKTRFLKTERGRGYGDFCRFFNFSDLL